jgi:hypothetical protein
MLFSPVQQLDFLFSKPLPSHKPPPSIQKLKTDHAAAGTCATPLVLEKCPNEERHSNTGLAVDVDLVGLTTLEVTFFPPAVALSPTM